MPSATSLLTFGFLGGGDKKMALNAFQQAVSNLAKSLGLKGAAEQQVYQRPEFIKLVEQLYGKIPLPPGIDPSMVTRNDGLVLEYKDAEGYVHTLQRDVNGGSATLGQVQPENTNRPAIVTPPAQQAAERQLNTETLSNISNRFNQGVPPAPALPDFSYIQNQLRQFPKAPAMPDFSSLFGQLNAPIPNAPTPPDLSGIFGGLNALQGQYGGIQNQLQQVFARLIEPAQLGQLSPSDLANLQAISASELAQQNQAFSRGQDNLLTRLYGQGVNQSTIANQASADLLQAQGILDLQRAANAAQRQLGLQQFLTQTGQGNLALAGQTAASGFQGLGQQANSLLGQGNLALGQGQLGLQGYQTQQGLNLQRLQQLASGMGQQGQLALGAYGAENDVRTNQLAQYLQSQIAGGQLGLQSYSAQQGFNQDLLGQMLQQLNSLNALDLNRQATSGQLGLDQQRINQQAAQFYAQLAQRQEEIRAAERAARPSLFDQIMRGLSAGVSIAAAPFTGGTSLLSGLGSLFGGVGGGQQSSLPRIY